MPTTKLMLFTVSKDEWNTKEDTVGVPKGTSRNEATSNNEKIKPVALAVIELCCLKASGRQLVSRSVENSVK